jgi:4a-hydroxytetrahydrobiopterin dehydratase
MTAEEKKEGKGKNLLMEEKCKPGAAKGLDKEEISHLLAACPQWRIVEREGKQNLAREFAGKNYAQIFALVGALVKIAESNNHHPQISFGYKRCFVEWTTHSAGGLSRNDFICAAQADAAARELSA